MLKKTKNESEDRNSTSGCVVDQEARIIYFFGEINEEKASSFVMAFNALDMAKENAPIKVVLDSNGGSTEAGYTVYDTIRLGRNIVVMEGYGRIYSMAVLVFQAADVRMIAPQAEIMIHDVQLESTGPMSVGEAVKLASDLVKTNKKYQRIICKHTGIDPKEFAQMCKKETYLCANTAVQMGFADGVIPATKKDVHPCCKSQKKKDKKS